MPIILDGSTGITVGTAVTIGTSDIKVGTATTISTTNISSNNPIIIGSATSTGTASQTLQVTGGAYVSGSVGIGTTNPQFKLDVFGGNLSAGGLAGDAYFVTYADVSGANVSIEGVNRANTIKRNLTLNAYGGNVLIGTTSATGTASQTLQVTGGAYVSGNLGVGITNPTSKLDVFTSGGQNQIRSRTDATNNYSLFVLQNTGASGREYHFGLGGSAVGGVLAGSAYLWDATAGAVRWYTDSSGNFVIGTTSATGTASQTLQVTGGAYVSGSVGIGTTNPVGILNLRGYTGGTVGSAVSSYTKTFVIGGVYNQSYNTGNSVLLHIADYSNDASDNVYPIYCEDENNIVDFWINSGNTESSASKKAYFGGLVGIGITNPGRKLDVASDASTPLIGGTQIGVINSSTSASTYTGISLNGTDSTSIARHGATITMLKDGTWTGGSGNYPGILVFTTRPSSGDQVERARITSAGYFKLSNDGTYISATSTEHEIRQSAASNSNVVAHATNASFAATVYYALATRSASTAYFFFIGNSGAGADNEFILRGDGNAFADGTWTGGGADYAEYFEWSDGNPDEEDRRGISVVLDGNKIRPAESDEDPIGVISGNPSVVGDAAWNKWSGKYLRDKFGTYILEDYEVEDEDGNMVIQQRRTLNPEYDPDVEYTSREERPEWDCVGLMGKLRILKGQPTGIRWIKMRDIDDTVEEWLVR